MVGYKKLLMDCSKNWMENLKKILDIRKASFIIIILPYLIFYRESNYYSPFFTYTNLALLVLFLIGFEVVFKWITTLNAKTGEIISFVVVFASVLLFYGEVINTYTVKFFLNFFDLFVRGRTILFSIILLFIILIFAIRKRKISYQIFNVFFLFFALFSFVSPHKKKYRNGDIHTIKSNYEFIPKSTAKVKPIILIISDEYSSPDALYKVNRDATIYDFSKKLLKQGWLVKNSAYSYEKSTIHSLSSIFNFNLSRDGRYSKQMIPTIGTFKLLHSTFSDSLKAKNVNIINYGILNIGESKPLNELYFYPRNFLENLLMFTSFYKFKYNTGGLQLKGLGQSYYPSEIHDQHIFKTLNDTVKKIKDVKTFIYVHLLMPHSPLVFNPDFSLREKNNLKNYEAYWRYTNTRLDKLLTELCKENKYKIILTGDHGLRTNSAIDFHNTFAAFYGFDTFTIDYVRSIQDIGIVINAGFQSY